MIERSHQAAAAAQTIAAASPRLFSSPMGDFDPAEREAAVARIKELVGQNKVRFGKS